METAVVQNFMLSLHNIVDTIRISDLIDIGVMSLVIYRLMWMVRKTSSGRVLRGVVVLLFAMWLCTHLELYATSFLLNKAVEWGILVLVILFQPEIRRFLERMGSGGLGLSNMFAQNTTSPDDIDRAIAETVEAYTSMSKDKVGALMVFERTNLLDDAVKTGTPLDCAISSELLKNIFFVKAPMHDGAVIVRHGRVQGAGCMLDRKSVV